MMHRSFQSLFPFILATLGCFLVLVGGDMPLFEWQIHKLIEDFAPTYKVYIAPSPWTAYLGDSLDDRRYMFHNISVVRSGMSCLGGDFDFTANRSAEDKAFERVFNMNMNVENLLWLLKWGFAEIGLTILYIWLFLIWNEGRRGWVYALAQTAIAGFSFLFISVTTRMLAGPFRFSPGIAEDYGLLDCYGKLTFAVALSKVHYETFVIVLIGILLELGGMVVILRQTMKAIVHKRESAQSDVG